MKTTIKRYKSGKPVLYYTWLPQWISSVLVPGKDVIWLTVEPAETLEGVVLPASLPTEETSGDNALTEPQTAAQLGFEEDQIRAVMNQDFAADNPAARTFLSLLQIPVADESAQNLRMMRGEKSPEEIKRHAANWIKKNRKTFDGWLEEARESVPSPVRPEDPADNTTAVNAEAETEQKQRKSRKPQKSRKLSKSQRLPKSRKLNPIPTIRLTALQRFLLKPAQHPQLSQASNHGSVIAVDIYNLNGCTMVAVFNTFTQPGYQLNSPAA